MTHSPKETSEQRQENNNINTGRRRISSEQLFATGNEIVIAHNGDDYRLRITSNGKLILTK